jgi:hypothetical protein
MGPNKAVGSKIAYDVANQYVALAEGLLAQALGRPHTLEELGDFLHYASALLAGSMYTILRERAGAKDAEGWMRRTLAMIATVVRLRGSDALLKFDVQVKDVPSMPSRRQPERIEEVLQQTLIPPCLCKKDAQGRCEQCAGTIATLMHGTLETITKMVEFGKKQKHEGLGLTCKACEQEQMDFAISKLVPDFVKMGDHVEEKDWNTFSQEMLGVLYQMGLMAGITEMPLTEAAVKVEIEAKKSAPTV